MRELAETTERIAHDRRVRHAYEDLCHKLHLETVPIQTPGFVGCGRAGLSSSSYSSSSSSAISWKKWNGKASSAEYQTRAGSGLLFQGRFYVQPLRPHTAPRTSDAIRTPHGKLGTSVPSEAHADERVQIMR